MWSAGTPAELPEVHTADEWVLDFGTTFPSLEYLSMQTIFLYAHGGEELVSILHMTSKITHLKHLDLTTSKFLKIRPSTLSITFHHLETLELFGHPFRKEHLQLLASLQWPSLTSLWYSSHSIYPNVVPCLLANTPKLKRLTVSIDPNQEFASDLANMFGRTEWPNLQNICLRDSVKDKETRLPEHVPEMQKACPNATIHFRRWNRGKYESRYFYGTHLSPQCNRACYKCLPK
jgi:hypothetical protein